MSFAILRTKRVGSINKCFLHNLRIKKEYAAHVDFDKTKLNEILFDKLDFKSHRSNYEKIIDKYIEEQKIEVRKNNNVKCLEFVLTASPEFFKEKPEKIEEWKKKQIEFLKKEFSESLLFAVCHLDEKTPHIQAVILADRKKIHKYKNQKGEFFKEKHTISPNDYNPEFLRQLQDRYAAANKKFDLVRGLRNSKATHRTLKEFYSVVEKVKSKDYDEVVRRKISKKLQEKKNLFGYIKFNDAEEILTKELNTILKQVKILKSTLNFNTHKNITELNKILKDKEEIEKMKKYYIEKSKELAQEEKNILVLEQKINALNNELASIKDREILEKLENSKDKKEEYKKQLRNKLKI